MTIPSAYQDRLHPKRRASIEQTLNDTDRYDLSFELANMRDQLGTLFEVERAIMDKHPNRPDLLIPVHTQIRDLQMQFIRATRQVQEVELSGQVFTQEKLARLMDKIEGIITYHVADMQLKDLLLHELGDITRVFKKDGVEGTLITPDQDVLMMDHTIPCIESTKI